MQSLCLDSVYDSAYACLVRLTCCAHVYELANTSCLEFSMHVRCPQEVLAQRPSAELRPTAPGEAEQDDEVEMGLTYSELSLFGKLRRNLRCGPFSMLKYALVHTVAAPSKAVCEYVSFSSGLAASSVNAPKRESLCLRFVLSLKTM